MDNLLVHIPFIMELSRKARQIIYQNMALSICISVCMIALSAFGVISALAGTMLHNLGAFVVLLNSFRILKNK